MMGRLASASLGSSAAGPNATRRQEITMARPTSSDRSPGRPEQPPTLFDMATITPPSRAEHAAAAAAGFPRLRYMGSKYRLVPHLAALFAELGGTTALDAFSGSGVVSSQLQSLGYGIGRAQCGARAC